MHRAVVSLKERSYPILVGQDLLVSAGKLIRKHTSIRLKNALVVTQRNIAELYGSRLSDGLTREGFQPTFFITPDFKSSESAKSQAVWSKLIKEMAAQDGSNKSLFIVALGGGVIGDLAGFAASVYRRGIPIVQIPTTVTAQVDSAIGGKTGIDLPEGKNLLGSIYQPELVLSDVSLLGSLPDRHWSDGFAEVIKYGVIKDTPLFSLLEKTGLERLRKDPSLLGKVIYRCAKIKAHVVAKDEFDKKEVRIVLNFGHTAGHAIETASRFSRRYTHGEAVAVGMLVVCDIAAALDMLRDAELPRRLEAVLVKYGLPLYFKGIEPAAILAAMGYDKKAEGGVNRFILPEALGKTQVRRNIPGAIILEALQKRKG